MHAEAHARPGAREVAIGRHEHGGAVSARASIRGSSPDAEGRRGCHPGRARRRRRRRAACGAYPRDRMAGRSPSASRSRDNRRDERRFPRPPDREIPDADHGTA